MIWDSHPLALGATPQQVWIDGIPQIHAPHLLAKPDAFQKVPETPNFDKEMEETLKYDGLPPLEPIPSHARTVVFTNVKSVFLRGEETVREAFTADSAHTDAAGVVVVRDGKVACFGPAASSACAASVVEADEVEYVDLEFGSISPGLVSTGSPLGLEEINQEKSTHDGRVADTLSKSVPALAGGSGALIRAVDGLLFGTRDEL